jgi:virulence-associated protein VagC
MSRETRAKVFWSGGSQAVRVPKALRLPAGEVTIERRGKGLFIVPIEEGDDWTGFWDRLLRLRAPVKRWKTRPVERRRPL